MRRRSEREYRYRGECFVKNFTTGVVSDTPQYFKYKPFEGKKSKSNSEQLIEGFVSTDEGRDIETISTIDFQVGYKIELDTGSYKIIAIGVKEDAKRVYGAIRNRPNIDIKVLVLT